MNEWAVSALVVVGILCLLALGLWLKENHMDVLIGIVAMIIGIILFIGFTSMVHDLIYNLIPTLQGLP